MSRNVKGFLIALGYLLFVALPLALIVAAIRGIMAQMAVYNYKRASVLAGAVNGGRQLGRRGQRFLGRYLAAHPNHRRNLDLSFDQVMEAGPIASVNDFGITRKQYSTLQRGV